jgi:hypothetical protein
MVARRCKRDSPQWRQPPGLWVGEWLAEGTMRLIFMEYHGVAALSAVESAKPTSVLRHKKRRYCFIPPPV